MQLHRQDLIDGLREIVRAAHENGTCSLAARNPRRTSKLAPMEVSNPRLGALWFSF